ncbi:hypothetical protein BS47DRAFT_1294617 [Hydnum rufescens UP504]|uniref:RNA-binding protein n=1 Tax=Hydnum rufescens UP504 TaxID=1448309 RepID=A0A9P6B0R7_9AGAM|nr:hypothetical protein BS47DRAFT_1294617 [Hydnum rufescens UP504]
MSDRNWRQEDDREATDYDNYGGTRGRGGQDWRRNEDRTEGDWKRRRINDEGSLQNQGHNDDGYGGGGGGGGDEYYDDYAPPRGDRDAYGHRRTRAHPSEPSEHVIFLGLDPDFTESDLHAFLTSDGFTLENVTIIRDRATGMSKSFGFAQFTSIAEAQRFLEPNFPFVLVPPPSHAIGGTYPTDDGSRARRVKIDFSQSTNPADSGMRSRGPRGGDASNDGTRDIGSAHVSVILLRGLDVGSTLDIIADALRSSEGPGRKSAKGMKRIILAKHKVSKISLGFAFVEFVDVQSASMVLANTMSPTLFPNGFRISGKPVAASFAHLHSFHQLPPDYVRDETCIDATNALGGRESGYAKYWDDNAVISELVFEVEEAAQPAAKKPKEKKKERKDVVLKDDVIKPLAPTALKDSLAPISLSLKSSKPSDIGDPKRPVAAFKSALDFGDDTADSEADQTAATPPQPEDKTNSYRKVPPMIASKRVANDINKWNSAKGDLQSEQSLEPNTNTMRLTATVTSAPVTVSSIPASTTAPSGSKPKPPQGGGPEFEYADLKKMACLLCSRMFKSVEQLRRHNTESDLHKKNLADGALREVALVKAAAAREGVNTSTPQPEGDSAPKYRDRALERRVIYGQPDMPVPTPAIPLPARKFAEGPTPPPRAPTPPPVINPGDDENNVGNKLLKKMGWSSGSGLGVSGEGRLAPIPTALYAQGVGLGASKPKEIGNGSDPFDYSSSVKESVCRT